MKSRALLVLPLLLILGLALSAALFLHQPARPNSSFACSPIADLDQPDPERNADQPLVLTKTGPLDSHAPEADGTQPAATPKSSRTPTETKQPESKLAREEAELKALAADLKTLIDEMPSFATISGTVRDQRGQPIEGAVVRATFDPAVASPAELAEGSRRRIRTNSISLANTEAGGTYTARVMLSVTAETASIALTLTAVHGAHIADAPVEVTLIRDETRSGLDLSMTLGASVKGTVRDGYGTPIEGARVYAGAGSSAKRGGRSATIGSTVTDAQGQYAMQGLKSGEVWVAANAEGYGPQDKGVDLSVTVGQEFLAPDITLAMQTAVKFKVTGGEFSSGKLGVTITPLEGRAQHSTADIGKDGMVLVACRFSGQATLSVTTAGFGTDLPLTISITDGIHNDLGSIELVAKTIEEIKQPRIGLGGAGDQSGDGSSTIRPTRR